MTETDKKRISRATFLLVVLCLGIACSFIYFWSYALQKPAPRPPTSQATRQIAQRDSESVASVHPQAPAQSAIEKPRASGGPPSSIASTSRSHVRTTPFRGMPQQGDVQNYFLAERPNPPGQTRSVNVDMVDFALASPDFGDMVQMLADQSQEDELLVKLNDSWRDAIADQLSEAGGNMRLERLACGIALCMGEAYTDGGQDSWKAWQARFASDPRTQAGYFGEYDVVESSDRVRRRFFFAIDDSINGGVVQH